MGGLDALDVAIFRATSHPRATFQWNIRESYRELAEGLGVDEETVRLRVKRLQEDGVLRGFEIVVNPNVLGRVMVRFDLPRMPPGRKDALIAQASLLDGVRWIFDHYGDSVGVVLFVERGDTPRLKALLESMGGCPSEAWELPAPPATVEVSPLDWRIIRALRRDPRRPYAELADELGVSTKTIARHVERLAEGRACFSSGIVDFSRLKGAIPVEIIVPHEGGADTTAVDAFLRSLPDRVFERCMPHVSAASVTTFSMGQVEDLRRRLYEVPGTKRARVHVLLRRLTIDTWLDARIEREAASEARAT